MIRNEIGCYNRWGRFAFRWRTYRAMYHWITALKDQGAWEGYHHQRKLDELYRNIQYCIKMGSNPIKGGIIIPAIKYGSELLKECRSTNCPELIGGNNKSLTKIYCGLDKSTNIMNLQGCPKFYSEYRCGTCTKTKDDCKYKNFHCYNATGCASHSQFG